MSARRRHGRDGYILVAVLSVMLLLTGLMASGSVLLRSALHSARLADDDVSLSGLEQSGLEITAYQLFVLKAPLSLVSGRPVRLAGATITPVVTDESGKIDLNGADPNLLFAAFKSVGVDAATATEVVKAIVALRGDPASTSPGASGAAPAPAPGGAPPPKPRGFLSVDQLGAMGGLTGADLRALAPRLTVFNPDGKINIMTASEAVLDVIPDLSHAAVADILARRQSTDKASVQSLQAMLGKAATYAKVEAGPSFTARISVVGKDGRRASVEAVIAASKSPSLPYYVLDWRD